ncbi:hypothetical protein B0H13DRAFT_1876248 [Mycena leptocephala]|nr:hypothetical protein B0H13DRAFT_1876248 [Mycena leptocephala]
MSVRAARSKYGASEFSQSRAKQETGRLAKFPKNSEPRDRKETFESKQIVVDAGWNVRLPHLEIQPLSIVFAKNCRGGVARFDNGAPGAASGRLAEAVGGRGAPGGRDTLVPVPVAVAVTIPEDRPTTVAVAEDLVDAEPEPKPESEPLPGVPIVGITHGSGSRAVGRVTADAGHAVPAAGRFEPVPFGAAEKRVDAAAEATIGARAVAEDAFAGAYDRPTLLEGPALRGADADAEGTRLRGRAATRGAWRRNGSSWVV